MQLVADMRARWRAWRAPVYKPATLTVANPVINSMLWATLPLVLIVQLSAAIILEFTNLTSIETQYISRLEALAERRAEAIATPLWTAQNKEVSDIAEEIVRETGVKAVMVYDSNGNVVASARSDTSDESSQTIVRPIRYTSFGLTSPAGRLEITYTRKVIFGNFLRALRDPILMGLSSTLAMLLALRLAANAFIGRPLEVMISTVKRSRMDGELYKAEIDTPNEFGLLAQSFNDMQVSTRDAVNKLSHMATHDALTGLPNRHALTRYLDGLAASGSGEEKVAVHFVDLDDFKAVNDTFGHEAGDLFLVHVARQLRAGMGPQDWAARLGGDEFIVVQRTCVDEDDAIAYASRLLESISQPLQIHEKNIVPRGSVGIALRAPGDPDFGQLVSLADIALYQAKATGTGTIELLRSAQQRLYSRRREIELAIPAAFAEEQFHVVFQAQVDLGTGRARTFEALTRWTHPDHGMIPPDEFMPLILRSGNSSKLAQFVLDKACLAVRRMYDAGYHDIRIAMNVTTSELTDYSFVESIREACALNCISPSNLEIEITEGSLINNFADASQILAMVRDLGVTVALDDFGTGYSSLAYLRRFALDKLKIDKAFVREIPSDSEDLAIVEIIASLARQLRLVVVAEGIEYGAQADALRGIGVATGQGYYFQRPSRLDDALAYLAAHDAPAARELRAAS